MGPHCFDVGRLPAATMFPETRTMPAAQPTCQPRVWASCSTAGTAATEIAARHSGFLVWRTEGWRTGWVNSGVRAVPAVHLGYRRLLALPGQEQGVLRMLRARAGALRPMRAVPTDTCSLFHPWTLGFGADIRLGAPTGWPVRGPPERCVSVAIADGDVSGYASW